MTTTTLSVLLYSQSASITAEVYYNLFFGYIEVDWQLINQYSCHFAPVWCIVWGLILQTSSGLAHATVIFLAASTSALFQYQVLLLYEWVMKFIIFSLFSLVINLWHSKNFLLYYIMPSLLCLWCIVYVYLCNRVIMLIVLNTFFIYRLYLLESEASNCALLRSDCILLVFSVWLEYYWCIFCSLCLFVKNHRLSKEVKQIYRWFFNCYIKKLVTLFSWLEWFSVYYTYLYIICKKHLLNYV